MCIRDSITVTDIARKADVDRKTFYKHFGSIDGLLAYVLDSHIDDIVEDVYKRQMYDFAQGRWVHRRSWTCSSASCGPTR